MKFTKQGIRFNYFGYDVLYIWPWKRTKFSYRFTDSYCSDAYKSPDDLVKFYEDYNRSLIEERVRELERKKVELLKKFPHDIEIIYEDDYYIRQCKTCGEKIYYPTNMVTSGVYNDPITSKPCVSEDQLSDYMKEYNRIFSNNG